MKICVITCDMNSTLGSVVPLAMFLFCQGGPLNKFSLFLHNCGLAPLIWGIFESPSTELQWGNWAGHEIQLQQAVSPTSKKYFLIIFLYSECFALLTKIWKQKLRLIFGITFVQTFWSYRLAQMYPCQCPLVLLINPCKFQENINTGKKSPSQKPKHIWGKVGFALKHFPPCSSIFTELFCPHGTQWDPWFWNWRSVSLIKKKLKLGQGFKI